MGGKRIITICGVRLCSKCGEWKHESNYRKEKGVCISCTDIVSKKWRVRNAEHLKRYSKETAPQRTRMNHKKREDVVGRARYMMTTIQNRLHKRNETTDLTWEYLCELMLSQGMKCKQTGIEFDLTARTRSDRSLLCPTVDRIEASKGYSKDNIQIVCWFYNVAKSNSTDAVVWSPMEQAVAFKAAG